MNWSEIVILGAVSVAALLIFCWAQKQKKQRARDFIKSQEIPPNPEDDPKTRDEHLEKMVVSIYVARQEDDFIVEQLPSSVVQLMRKRNETKTPLRISADPVDFDDTRLIGHRARHPNGRTSERRQ